jgi:membrane-bound metal-dependent hydrolase YbcI (DUF457 family)
VPSPLAHAGLALCLYAAACRTLDVRTAVVVAATSVLPDLDVIPMLWDPHGVGWHRGPTHSVLGAAGIGAASSFLVTGWKARLCVIAAAVMHVPLDWSTGEPGAPAKYGVPAFWPLLADKYIASRPWFGAYGIDQPRGLGAMFDADAVAIYGKEALTVAGGAVLAALARRWS